MILLKNIKRQDNIITLDAFIEDSKEALPLSLDIKKRDFKPFTPPKDCKCYKSHIAKAKWTLLKIIESGEELPKERLVYWY